MNANNPERVDKTERVGKISGLESGHQLENGGRPRAENVIVRGARELNSHARLLNTYRRMLRVFNQMRRPNELSVDQIFTLLKLIPRLLGSELR